MTDTDFDNEPRLALRKTLIAGIGGVVLLFLVAFLAGYVTAMIESGEVPAIIDFAIIGTSLVLIGGVAFGCVKFWPNTGPEPIGPSVKRSRDLMYAMIGLSLLAGMAFAVAEGPDEYTLFSNGPIGSTTAIVALIGWLIIFPIITFLWWQSINEHEASSYRDSSMFAAHAYLFIAPAWWMASRAGWVPDQDPMIVLIIITIIWCAAWIYRKFA